jgi:hypothetical protein
MTSSIAPVHCNNDMKWTTAYRSEHQAAWKRRIVRIVRDYLTRLNDGAHVTFCDFALEHSLDNVPGKNNLFTFHSGISFHAPSTKYHLLDNQVKQRGLRPGGKENGEAGTDKE